MSAVSRARNDRNINQFLGGNWRIFLHLMKLNEHTECLQKIMCECFL